MTPLSYPLSSATSRERICESVFSDVQRGYGRVELPFGMAYVADGASLADKPPVACCIGAFDGLHLGHRDLVGSCMSDARSLGVLSAAVTFDPDPSEVLSCPSARLLGCADRLRGLMSLGLDLILVVRFDECLAATDYRAFLEDRLGGVVRLCSVHVGSNFRFGAGGAGDVAAISSWGEAHGVRCCGHDLVCSEGLPVSATRIRSLVASGDIDSARELLGRCHFVSGVVEHGRGQGRAFGFPTANMRFSPLSCVPGAGVYAGFFLFGGRAWPAAVNVGVPPSFGGPDPFFLEAHLVGFEGDIYGRSASVVFVRWLRPSRVFASTEELETVVRGNIDWVQENLGVGLGDSGLEVSA